MIPNKESVASGKASLCWLIFGAAWVFGILWLFAYPGYWPYFLGPLHLTGERLYPFLDMHGRLAAFEATRMGIDILYNPNPLDPLSRINIKPTWPLGLSFLGLGRSHLVICGIAAGISFIAITLSWLRPQKIWESFLLFFICFSPAVLLGIERANDDLVYFSLLALVPLSLRLRSDRGYWFAWLVIFLLAPAKYYPGAVFLVLLGEVRSWRQLGLLFGTGVLFVAAYATINIEEILYLRNAVPSPSYYMAHGGALAFAMFSGQTFFYLIFLILFFVLGGLPIFRASWPEIDLTDSDRRWLLLGSSVFGFCFLLNSNFDYRLIFILPTLPALLRIARSCGHFSYLAKTMIYLLPLVFWMDILVLHTGILTDLTLNRHLFEWVAAIKSMILWFYVLGLAVFCGTVLRSNLRAMFLALRSEFNSNSA